mgnify:FL=1
MKQHMQTLVNLLVNNDFEALLQHYQTSDESENIAQLAFLFQQGQLKLESFDFYQQIATKFIASKCLPSALIKQFNSNDILSFFTPALQLKDNFNETNHLQRNVLHYLLAGEQSTETKSLPPFNYLRSMMLFESNESLRDALCQRDGQNYTPIEAYLMVNQNLAELPTHELTALLALIEIQSKQQTTDMKNYQPLIQAVGKLCRKQKIMMSSDLQRLILIAAYYNKPVKQVLFDID